MKIPTKFAAATRQELRGLSANWCDSFGRNVFLHGPVGCGKTYAAVAMLKSFVTERRRLGAFANVPELFENLRSSYDSETEDPRPQLIASPLLVLDDLCVERSTDWAREQLYVLINTRYNEERLTIYTSNVGIDQVAELYGEQTASRIVENCSIVKMEGPDRRTPALSEERPKK
jgi:DNA replication protein DnaC